MEISRHVLPQWVRVISGADGSELFQAVDRLQYEARDRAFPLGDLDGDGFGELAIVYPRRDRSAYDIVFSDWLFGVHSWVAVVSGALARREGETD